MEDLISLESDKSSMKIVKNPQMKQAFGKAKLFEIRRLVRRIKQLSAKKGTTQQLEKNKRKVARLEKQLEVLKDLHVDAFIKAAIAKAKDERLDCDNFMSTDDEDVDTKMNVLERILNIVGMDNIKDLLSEVKSKKMEVRSNRHEKSLKTIKKLSSKNIGTNLVPKNKIKTIKNSHPDKELENSETDTEMERNLENLDDFFSDPVAQDYNSVDVDKSCLNSSTFSKEEAHKRRKFNGEDDFDEISPKAFDSVFVGSLKSGKQQKNGKNKRKNFKGKRDNRLGQRGRRKQWEKLYGNKANHLKKEKKNLENSKEGNKKKFISKPFQDRRTKHLHEKTDSSLHPSWEASKSKRKQESIVEFKGQKITFED